MPPTLLSRAAESAGEALQEQTREETAAMPESRIQLQKSVVGASSVTLIPSTMNPASMQGDAAISQVVVSTSAATPPPAFWGVASDGVEFELILRRKS
jgi:hypothetical protein